MNLLRVPGSHATRHHTCFHQATRICLHTKIRQLLNHTVKGKDSTQTHRSTHKLQRLSFCVRNEVRTFKRVDGNKPSIRKNMKQCQKHTVDHRASNSLLNDCLRSCARTDLCHASYQQATILDICSRWASCTRLSTRKVCGPP